MSNSELEANSGINTPQIKKKKKFWTWKKALAAAALTTFGLGVGGFYFHKDSPTFLSVAKYAITDPFTETQQEKDFEKKFGVEYFGDKTPEAISRLERHLDHIKKENPDALNNCNFIIFHKQEDLDKWCVKPFLDYGGRAWPVIDLVELCNSSESTVAHELGHIEHFNSSSKMDKELLAIHGDTLGKLIQRKTDGWKELTPTWLDGTSGPKNGYPGPYAAKNLRELVAEYIESAGDSYVWSHPGMQDPRCLQTVEVLAKYGRIPKNQLEKIKEIVHTCNPQFITKFVQEEINKVTRPSYLRSRYGEFYSSDTFYESTNLEIYYSDSSRGSNLGVNFQLIPNQYITFSFAEKDGELTINYSSSSPLQIKDAQDLFPKESIDKLKESGYDLLFNWDFRLALKPPRGGQE